MRILDRYLLRNFLEPFLLCCGGFLAIWLVFDLYDNAQDFITYRVPIKTILSYYVSQFPDIILLSVPVGLLLALLFSLSRMSRHNEIISMLTAGRSLPRLLMPLIGVALACTGFCFWLNYDRAPHAAAIKKRLLEEITRGEKKAEEREIVQGHVFRNRQDNRTWYIRKMYPIPKTGPIPNLEGVHIMQQDAEGNVIQKWYASRANFDEQAKVWKLNRGMIVKFDTEGNIIFDERFTLRGWKTIAGWSETPRRIASSQLDAQDLSVQELHDYLGYNSDFPPAQLAPYKLNLADRFAFPWSCFVVVFIAAPLGIVYSRRGVLTGVASALLLFAIMILTRYLFLAFGKGGRLEPTIAAWGPHLIFLAIGLTLLYIRNNNKELKLAFWK